MPEKRIRVVIAKIGLDGHDRGAKVVARYLKDAGMEVIYTGPRQTVEQVVNTVVQEDANVLGMSFLAGDHMVLIPRVMERLRQEQMTGTLVLVGGIISKRQETILKAMGINRVFYAGTDPNEIVQHVKESVRLDE